MVPFSLLQARMPHLSCEWKERETRYEEQLQFPPPALLSYVLKHIVNISWPQFLSSKVGLIMSNTYLQRPQPHNGLGHYIAACLASHKHKFFAI